MANFQCTICDYVYSESIGDPAHGVTKGTKFRDLPKDWKCPVCGAGKAYFVMI